MQKSKKDLFFVSLQLLLFLALIPDLKELAILFPRFIYPIGIVLLISGVIIVLTALLQLNKNLSPFPTPKTGGHLIQTGLFHYVRHPIYSGIILSAFGLAFFSGSGSRLLVCFLLYVLFYFKSNYEELKLIQVYPEYIDYKKRTTKFFPKINVFR
ncbi:MAG TPA: isoprenylcysteine carboxylmethyltransferase family protein [Edaphocola sp.]|nr:isoprenylcysteine carboxylmethyltransferase family protein [Edaphocola sp.]